MKNKRPVNLDITTIRWPLSALTSITHRISGVALFLGVGVLLYLFDLSLSGEAGFNRVSELLSSGLFSFVLWLVLSALAYHTVAGVKHLLLDIGIGESFKGGPIGAGIVAVVSAILIILLGVWLW